VLILGFPWNPSKEVWLPAFVAHVEFHFDADDLVAANERLQELVQPADMIGFSFKRSRVEEAPAEGDEASEWTSYGPISDG